MNKPTAEHREISVSRMTKATAAEVQPLSLSPREAGKLIGVSREHIYRLINKQEVKACRSGIRWLVDYQDLCAYYQRLLTT